MSTNRENEVVLASGLPDRRRFLSGLGVAAWAGSITVGEHELQAATQATGQGTGQKKKSPSPNSGVAGIKELLGRKDPATWVFLGDDITHGAVHTKGFRSYPEHFAERVRWELKRMRDLVVNSGVSGDDSKGVLADLDWRALHLKPDVVSIMLGMHDSKLGPVGHDLFRKNLTAIVNKVKSAGAIPVLHTPNPVYLKKVDTGVHLPGYAQVVRDVALGTKAILVDHHTFWETAKPDQEELLKWLDDEKVHPGYFGHRVLARQLFAALEIADDASPTCNLEVP
ncbi:MAG: SGNH/GDSL hydrolase family protein [Planctomycetia bacterium]|nr:SGNH/GDSL hydrolase family protein [Planctomycetia bacterium]